MALRLKQFLSALFCVFLSLNVNAAELIAHRAQLKDSTDSNSLAAVRAAYAAGVSSVEIDVRISRDGVVYLFHDDDNHGLSSKNLTFSRMQHLHGRLTRLAELFDAPLPGLRFILDLKSLDAKMVNALAN